MSSFVITFAMAEPNTRRMPVAILLLPIPNYGSKPQAKAAPTGHCSTVGIRRLDQEKIVMSLHGKPNSC